MTIWQPWFRWWRSPEQAISHYLNQWWHCLQAKPLFEPMVALLTGEAIIWTNGGIAYRRSHYLNLQAKPLLIQLWHCLQAKPLLEPMVTLLTGEAIIRTNCGIAYLIIKHKCVTRLKLPRTIPLWITSKFRIENIRYTRRIQSMW